MNYFIAMGMVLNHQSEQSLAWQLVFTLMEILSAYPQISLFIIYPR